MDKQELDILIDKFILGTISHKEKEKLEAHIMEIPTTKLEIQMRRDIVKGLEYNSDQELKSILEQIHNEEISGSKNNALFKKIGVALLCLVLILGAYFLYHTMTSDTGSGLQEGPVLYANYFQPFETALETRSTEITDASSLTLLVDAYKQKNYEKVLEEFEPLAAQADNNILLIAGISAMEIDSHDTSIAYFDRIIDSNDFYFLDHAKWYKALALLKTNEISKAKTYLNDLATNPKADHHDDSISLLREI